MVSVVFDLRSELLVNAEVPVDATWAQVADIVFELTGISPFEVAFTYKGKTYQHSSTKTRFSPKDIITVNWQLYNGKHSLHMATTPKAVKMWIDHGVDVDIRDTRGETPLMCAAQFELIDAAEKLMSLGADANAVDDYGWTPLHHAVAHQKQDILIPLLRRMKTAHVPNKDELTPSMLASRQKWTLAHKILSFHM